jgi:trk system potassium uptake protein TrkH
MSAIATVPLMLGLPGLSFTDAFFETMSGLSTTGATVLTGLDTMAPSLNLWRHALIWYGGMGIIVLVVAILPMLGVGGMLLGPSPEAVRLTADKLLLAHHADGACAAVRVLLITLAASAAVVVAGMTGSMQSATHSPRSASAASRHTTPASATTIRPASRRSDRVHADFRR